MNKLWTWRRQDGYEVSSKGDTRFSAFYAIIGSRTIEEIYQCDIKDYDPGGKNWRLGKGKPGLNPSVDLWKEYLGLWEKWAEMNPLLIIDLKNLTNSDRILTDRFATTPINQAHALSVILNRRFVHHSLFDDEIS